MISRRALFGFLVTAGGAVAAGIIGVPGVLMALGPLSRPRRRDVWTSLGRLEDFPIGEVRTIEIARRPRWPRPLPGEAVFVSRLEADELVAFSRRCTDLACPLTHDEGSGCYFCPCHGGIFSTNGDVMAGPPDRPMDRYASRVRDGIVEIDLASLPLA